MSSSTQPIPGGSVGDAPQTIGFLLLPQFSMMAFVSAVEPLRVANRLAQRDLYRWEVLSDDGRSITASNGMALVADRAYAEAHSHSLVVVCAGFQPESGYNRRLKRWLSDLARGGVDLGAMDTGSFLLAWAGLLNGYKATTHWESLDSFREQFPEVEAENSLFVIDRNRLTCAGGTAALDMMLHLISVRHGHRLAAAVSEQFIHAQIRDPHDRQRMEPRMRQGINHAGLARVIGLMEANLEEPLSSDKLSEAAGMSLRQLERLFHRHFGTTPRRYYLDLRLQRARALLQYTDMSMVEITVACGFGSAAHFSRSYHAWAGKPPSAERYRDVAGVMPALR
ncbi:MAG TPA: GlxA family transcriptional regulator [Dongiaceae bacterium]|nr:GlxA family transcriptional regulator [Dongiaceae bacterium]